MKKYLLLGLVFLGTTIAFSQAEMKAPESQLPELTLEKAEWEANLRFLASDEMQGRRTGTVFNNIAARYIAEQLRAYGVQELPGAEGYLQELPFVKKSPPKTANFSINDKIYSQGDDLIMLGGNEANLEGQAVFAGHGWVDAETGDDDYRDLDVEGKIVVVLSGNPNSKEPFAAFEAMPKKRKIAKEKGATALIEIYQIKFPWGFFKRFMNRERLTIEKPDASNDLPYGWINTKEKVLLPDFEKKKNVKKVTLVSSGVKSAPSPAYNVAGVIPGNDPKLREEFVLLSAHFDHVGTGRDGGGRFTAQDSIFNGTRDNGMGTVALMAAAKALAKTPPKRSTIILAVTGEEIGLLGSAYYAENPLIPLEKTVFNLNTDGAGYDHTSAVSITGWGRTGTDAEIETAAQKFELQIIPDPAPEQNLYDRSDNVSFAKMGVPAICFSPGTTGFSPEIQKYYHQVADNPDSVDYDYLLKFCQSFAHAARQIGDMKNRPSWKEGDKYEEAGKALYK